MPLLSVCILTHNSMRTIERCLLPALKIADEMIVVDSGSSDGTLEFLRRHGVEPIHRAYETHAIQMNYAIGRAHNDWVLCIDSDEFLDDGTVAAIATLKPSLQDESEAWRLTRYWHVLGGEVRAVYPCSSPDMPVRLFNRRRVRFNDQPVDDKPVGFVRTHVLHGHVVHDTFFSLHEILTKLNGYTSRLVEYQEIKPSLLRAASSAIGAGFKWYVYKQAWRDGTRGVVTSTYAMLYSFLKYFKAWCRAKGIPLR